MGYIYERLVRSEYVLPAPVEDAAVLPGLMAMIYQAKVVHAGSVLDYFERSPLETLPEGIEIVDFPNLRPPCNTLFVEHGAPPALVMTSDPDPESFGDTLFEDGCWRHGCLIRSVDLEDEGVSPSQIEWMRKTFARFCGDKAYTGQLRWVVAAYLFGASPLDGVVHGPLVSWFLAIREDGSVEREMSGWDAAIIGIPNARPDAAHVAQRKYEEIASAQYLSPTLFAIATMNSPHTKAQPIFTPGSGIVYELNADRLQKILNVAGNAQDFGLRRAMQICKRHFFSRRQTDSGLAS